MRTIEDLKSNEGYKLVKEVVQNTGIQCSIYVNNLYYFDNSKPRLFLVCDDDVAEKLLDDITSKISDEELYYCDSDKHGIFVTALPRNAVGPCMSMVEEVVYANN